MVAQVLTEGEDYFFREQALKILKFLSSVDSATTLLIAIIPYLAFSIADKSTTADECAFSKEKM